jgi:calcineurin-like phosphoesterase family protein
MFYILHLNKFNYICNMNMWFTSDTHYGHTNIAGESVSRWQRGYRDFGSVWEMNKSLIEGINKYVKEDDILYHLGDWSFGGIHNIKLFRDSIICQNIHLILGNHDEHIVDKEVKFHDSSFNPIELFSSVQDVLHLEIGKIKIFLSHYSHRVWNGSHKGVVHLYGHSHASIPDFGRSMDVGVDVAYKMFGEYRPFNIGDISRIMEKREIHKIDCHA